MQQFEILKAAAENTEFNISNAFGVERNNLQILLEEVRQTVLTSEAKIHGRSHG